MSFRVLGKLPLQRRCPDGRRRRDRATPGVALNGTRVAAVVAREDKGKEGGKGKGDGKDEDYEFIPADFDEDAFIHKEMVSFRTTSILFLWGIVAALVSWGLFAAVDGRQVGWLIGLAVCAAFGFSLKLLFPRLKADVKHFGRREWLGTAFLFFFTWLAFFIIAVNPPVSDFAAPRVDLMAGPFVQQSGGDVTIDAFYEDNDRVVSHDFSLTGPDGAVPGSLEDLGRGHHRFVATDLEPGIYVARASAKDANGHEQNATTQFTVVDVAVRVYLPEGNKFDSPTDTLLVQTEGVEACRTKKGRVQNEPCIRAVHLDFSRGGAVTLLNTDDKLYLESAAAEGGWKATSNFAGWPIGNVSFHVTAEVIGQYSGAVFVDGGDLVSGPYNVTVPGPVGAYVPKVIKDPGAPARDVPGVGAALLVVGLLAAVAIARRK